MAKKPDFKALANRAAKRDDQTKTTSGGDFPIIPEGTTYGRLIEYIEIGNQKREPYQGKERPPVPQVLIGFELLGKKYLREVEVDGKKKLVSTIIRPRALNKSLHPKANYKKLFDKMRYGRDGINHMAQMLGEAFQLTITHNESGEGDKKKTYANLTDADGVWKVSAPIKKVRDADGDIISTEPAEVRESIADQRLFIWDEPTQEAWDSIFIDGERVTKDAKGKEITQSKNYLQNLIVNAVNFEGSPIQTFLEGSEELPENPEELVENEASEDEVPEEEAEPEAEAEDEAPAEEVEDEAEEAPAPKAKAKAPVKAAPAKAKVTAASQLAAKKAAVKAPVKAVAKAPAKTATKAVAKPAAKAPVKKAAEGDNELLRQMGLMD